MYKVKRASVRAAFQLTQPFVADRAGSFPEEIRGISGNILVYTHVIAMKGILEYLTPDSVGSYWSRYIGNCTVYMVENDAGKFGIPRELI